MKNLVELIQKAKSMPGKKVSLAGADEVDALLALEKARAEGIADGVLVGNKDNIAQTAETAGIDLSNYEIAHVDSAKEASKKAVSIIRDGGADALMKGLVSTADFMRAILDKERGLIASKLLSHIALFEIPHYHKLLGVTDAAINIAPTIEEKAVMISNAVKIFHNIGIDEPKVACVCAVEKVNPGKMPCTEDAAILAGMNRAGQIAGCIVDGPFGLDNAVNAEAAQLKGITDTTAGDADLILCPNIESANVLYKTLAYLAGCTCGAIVVGTSAPVILTSRADTDESKFASLALGIAAS
ncbi:MAG TPA: bifunctional enoyl-CoA hydratase/phosphate acetyltransferase [candidate division Zixibacteria bacterium]|nr:bifunctional enoyl-CoA hydratase/phosphate acetyltransferase [candidate division Zixibacteria bacterium]